jgi:hypothetical protein
MTLFWSEGKMNKIALKKKKSCDLHVFTFPSGLTGEGDRMATLTILKTLGGHIANF